MKNTVKKIKMTMFRKIVIVLLIAGITSCAEDNIDPTLEEEEEVETVFVRGVNNYTPNGSIRYLDIVPSLATEPNFANMVELGLNVEVYAFGEHPYSINRDSKTITKWKVDKTDMKVSVEGILSFASTGVNSNILSFVSDEKGYISDLTEGIIVEFNPKTMVLVKTHNVTPLQTSTNFGFYTEGNVYNGRLIFPIQWTTRACCAFDLDLKATVGIFDPATGSLTYDTDDRAIGVNFALYHDAGTAYLVPANSQNSWIAPFYEVDPNDLPNANVILRLNSNGTIDDNFVSDINATLPKASVVRGSSFVFQGKYIFTHSNEPVSGAWNGRFANRGQMQMVTTSYDINTKEAKPFTSFDGYNGVFPIGTIDDVNYFKANILGPTGTSDFELLVQNSPEDYTKLTTVVNGTFTRIYKLW